MIDPYDQTPEGKLVRALLVKALFNFVPDAHALVIEHNGDKYDLVHQGDDMIIVQNEYDTEPGTIVPVMFVEGDEEEAAYHMAKQQMEELGEEGEVDMDTVLDMLHRLPSRH